MKIAFVINQTHKEEPSYTTTLLALRALQRGHHVYYIGLADFYYNQEIIVAAHARQVLPNENIQSGEDLLHLLCENEKIRINLINIDVLWLRFDPSIEMTKRPWAAEAGLQFAELAQKQGVWVINNPTILARASNKLYLENFDESIRPKTIITRNHTDVEHFFKEQNEHIILKPLKGSGGKNVFIVNKDNPQNLKQIEEAIARDGYVIAQEYLPAASEGDIRFFLLDGKPIEINGKYAAIQRVGQKGDIRSNIHQGGTTKIPNITEEVLQVASKVSEQLIRDGMYLVGLDIVGDKIMEINVFSPGALTQTEKLYGEDFGLAVIKDLENKYNNRKHQNKETGLSF